MKENSEDQINSGENVQKKKKLDLSNYLQSQ